MSAHSALGASSAHRWLQCPGSFRLSQSAPHRPSSIYAATGTLAHEYIERAVKKGVSQIDRRELGRKWLREGHEIAVDADFLDGVDLMLDYLQQKLSGNDWMDVEFRVSLDEYFIVPPPVPLFGTVDIAAHSLHDETLEIVDYKNGSGVVVTPTENPQMLFYAAGVLKALPVTRRDWVKNIILTIVQPHAQGMNPIRSWETSLVDLLMWVDEVLVPGVEACATPDAPLNPGSWCRFCPVSHACPRLQQDAVAMAQREFDDIAPGIDPKILAKQLEVAELAQLWIDRLREFAVDQLQHQVRIPGWGLVPTRPSRKWLEPDSDIAQKLDHAGVMRDEIWETRVRSPAQMEKVLHRTKVGRSIWDRIATTLFENRSTGVKLGRTDRPDAKGEFTDVEE